ncbi:phosphoribosylaminoimidazolesuccinocarboxamide synthase [Thermoflavimicrobium dichotomicum]|uniref:Phosphoribosylaminoimidazole-succinocarboxamide synthase n=1 Tax=Thermoflavimicrobium dichotomicum TaxID=46223 RepID=A0A1I3RJR7_9BACL|nr:phosphoribosylaminoimidazole-succinocarboxamide synthase [Thermoflavimicrobium dichotomicum]
MEELLYEGKAKQLFQTEDPNILRVKYKDDATAFNGEKKARLTGKGELNNQIAAWFFQFLKDKGVPNHFIRMISPTEQLVKKVAIIPLEVVVRNIVAGSLAKRLGLEEGTSLRQPVVEFYYKNDDLGDPLINQDHIAVLELASEEQLHEMKTIALQVNELIRGQMDRLGITLVDFKLEFGIDAEGRVLLADEISPDTCRFWDQRTKERLDKDRFRRDLGQVIEAYEEILSRLGGKQGV